MATSQSILLSGLCILGVVLAFFFIADAIRKDGRHRLFLLLVGSGILVPSVLFFLTLNLWITDPRFRTFRSFYYDIEEGMTREEVIKALLENYPRDGERERPIILWDNETNMGFNMNTEENRHTAEGFFLEMENGVVVKKRYSAD